MYAVSVGRQQLVRRRKDFMTRVTIFDMTPDTRLAKDVAFAVQ